MDPKTRIAQKMAALADMGFRRVEDSVIPSETVPVGRNRKKVTTSQPSMGTLVSVTGIHESADLLHEASGRAFEEMHWAVAILNRYDTSSALSYLNTEGSIQLPPPELAEVMSQAWYFHRASAGAFDATVQPLVDLFRTGLGPEMSSKSGPSATTGTDPKAGPAPGPSEARVLEARALVDGRRVKLGADSISFQAPGMGVTLDGIAKGYVVDRMASVLAGLGIENFLINAGGDIRTAGFREDGEPWRVGVQDPKKQGDLPDVIGLSNGAVATSGSYEIYYDRDRSYHHIVSARTGDSPRSSESVSVVAPTALAADALATAVFVMDPERGVAFIESLPGCACLVVDHTGRQKRSSGWRSATGTDLPPPRQG